MCNGGMNKGGGRVVKFEVISLGVVRYCESAGIVRFGAGMPEYGGLGTVQVCRSVLWHGMIWWGLVVCRYAGVWTHTGPSLCVTSGTSSPHSSNVIQSLIHPSIAIQI